MEKGRSVTMASIKMLKVYKSIEEGKRVVSVTTAELPALSMWLWRHGYTQKVNRNGKVCNVLIEEKQ